MRHEQFATSVAFSADGRWLASSSFDKTARLWSLPPRQDEMDIETMRNRTWVALGAKLGPHGGVEAILWQEWQRLREELRKRDGSKSYSAGSLLESRL